MNRHSFLHSARNRPVAILPVLCAGLALAFGGCAHAPIPSEQMAVSSAALTNAVGAGATELAPGDMRLARDKLDRAQAALVAEDYLLARTLAEQSEVDAQLAVARSRATKAQKAAVALSEDSRILREEIERKAR